ncbi:MAG: extracellular solute-binding protein, partial [Anaerolineaceae bacterium]|nr:extracellular solute-binding protein [Anaerolineaceae bacterium]
EGKQYSLPQFVHAGGNISIIWNKTILGEAGIEEPIDGWTWEDLAEMALKATNREKGIFGVSWNVRSIHYLTNYTRCWGEPRLDDHSGWVMSEDGRKFEFTKPAVAEACKLYLELRKAGAIPGPEDEVEGGLFVAGRQAFIAGGVADKRAHEAKLEGRPDAFELGATMRPVGPKGREGTCFSGNQWMINSKSASADAAWDVMKALTDKEISTWGILHGALQPGRRSCWLDPEVVEQIPTFKPCAAILDGDLEPFPMPWNLRFVEAEAIFNNESDAIWFLDKTWDEYAPVVEKKVQEVLDLDRPF